MSTYPVEFSDLEKENEELKLEIHKLRFALKSSIEVTFWRGENIEMMNRVGAKFGVASLKITPPPAFIEKALKGE